MVQISWANQPQANHRCALFRSCVDPLLSYLRNDVSMPILTVDANKGAHSPRYNP